MLENSYGYKRRIEFITDIIREKKPNLILDIGCGTGIQLSQPLVEQFPNAEFHLVEADAQSLSAAKNNLKDFSNVKFFSTIPGDAIYDFVIASEVLEHTMHPLEFLVLINNHLKPAGILLLTVPNGYGPSEMLAAFEYAIRILKRSLWPKRGGQKFAQGDSGEDTLADSPHLQFFSFASLNKIVSNAGFSYRLGTGRMFICGFVMSPLIDKFKGLIRINVFLGEFLPKAFVSNWLLCFEKNATPVPIAAAPAEVNFYTKVKRWLTTHPALRRGAG